MKQTNEQQKQAIDQLELWTNQALKKCKTLEKQKNYVRKRARANEDVMKLLVEHALQQFSFNKLYKTRHSNNRDIMRAATLSDENPEESMLRPEVYTRVKNLENSMFDYVCGNKRLGDCTREDLIVAINTCEAEENGWRKKKSLYQDILKLIKPGMTLQQCVKLSKIRSIFRKYEMIKKTG